MTEGFLAMPAIEQAFVNEIPMGKLPSTDDMANAALWLLSDESFMTGRMLDISGGANIAAHSYGHGDGILIQSYCSELV
jgi:NAD(P)-dependent dehydrogenase (short-subunit alcohol dehydrogenase family)